MIILPNNPQLHRGMSEWICPKRCGSWRNGASDSRTVWAEGEFSAVAEWGLRAIVEDIEQRQAPVQLPPLKKFWMSACARPYDKKIQGQVSILDGIFCSPKQKQTW